MHGGKTEKAAARAQAETILKTLGDVQDDVDPAEALLQLVKWKHAETLWLRQKVQEVDPDPGEGGSESLTWGVSKHDEGIGAQGPVDVKTHESQANIWWRLLREAEDQLAKYSALALKAGVERRQIELQEAQAVHLAGAINRILDALELSAEQQKKVPTIVPQVLRGLVAEEK
ncbi:hypothetical protein GCM10009618_02490 [Nesterenkonia lacusekhoensis]